MYEISQHANSNALGALGGVNRSTRNISKAEYDKRMPVLPLRLSKREIIDRIWYIFTLVFENDHFAATFWPEEVFNYFLLMGSIPAYNTNQTTYNALYKFDSKRGYFELMKRLSKEKVLGLYSWLSGRYLDLNGNPSRRLGVNETF